MAFISGEVPEQLVRDMTTTPQDFERDLRKAWPAGVERTGQGRLRVQDGTLLLEIELVPQGVRRIGLFALERLNAHYRFSGGDAVARHALLTRLDRAMQRGGG